jgi:thiamine pyrophosphokinase
MIKEIKNRSFVHCVDGGLIFLVNSETLPK